MKGILFRGLEEYVVEHFGMEKWNTLMDSIAPEGRTYLSTQSYPDAELVNYVMTLSDELALTSEKIQEIYGEYLFPFLANKHKSVVSDIKSLEELLFAIDGVIHIEVRKLYDEPNLPTIECIQKDGFIRMHYRSPRMLCHCAVGLMKGAANFFKKKVSIEHNQCMHRGSEECIFDIYIGADSE